MVQLEDKFEEYYCYNCDTEFTVSFYEDDKQASFCPYCGSEIENEEEDEDLEEEDDFLDDDDDYEEG